MVRAGPTGALIIVVIGLGATLLVKQWRRAAEFDPDWPLPARTISSRRWQLALGVLLMIAWMFAATAFIDAALRTGCSASSPRLTGSIPPPQWFALALPGELYHVLWYVLMTTGFWFALGIDRKDGVANAIRIGYCGMIWLFAFISLSASVASIWH